MPVHTHPQAAGRKLVLIHGFLDNATTWLPLADALAAAGHSCTTLDLAGAGARQAEAGPYTLARAVDDAVSRLGTDPGPVVLIGHSMGAQVAELAALRLGTAVSALILLTPTPLEGNTLPDEVRALLRESGGDVAAQETIRRAFSRNLSEAQIRSAVESGLLMGKEAARGYYDAFTGGDPAGGRPTGCAAPVLILGAADDPVIGPDMVRRIRMERFPSASLEFIAGSGHWPQIEQAGETARVIADFLRA